jgi:hypothetical protein
MFSLQSSVHTSQCSVFSLQCTSQCSVFSIQCPEHISVLSVQSSVSSAHLSVQSSNKNFIFHITRKIQSLVFTIFSVYFIKFMFSHKDKFSAFTIARNMYCSVSSFFFSAYFKRFNKCSVLRALFVLFSFQ